MDKIRDKIREMMELPGSGPIATDNEIDLVVQSEENLNR